MTNRPAFYAKEENNIFLKSSKISHHTSEFCSFATRNKNVLGAKSKHTQARNMNVLQWHSNQNSMYDSDIEVFVLPTASLKKPNLNQYVG